ncbi:MAG: aminotransferase class IV [Phycisphaeraceae bacterium]|nr:aminotransferase class IV [Phycisphaeraceae bacterium]
MSNIYLNGQYIPRQDAKVSIEDRGFLLADGVYEVLRIYNGKPFMLDLHVQRLCQSLAAIRLPADIDCMVPATMKLLQQSNLRDARAYWQVTRGPAPRNHAFPAKVQPTVLVMVDPVGPLLPDAPLPTDKALLADDRRWLDCAIKSLMLLPNVLARQQALEAGCGEAIFHRGAVVSEGAATSVFAVIDGELRTHPTDGSILPGVTRAVVLELAKAEGIALREQAFTVDDMARAEELILTGTTKHVTAVTSCGGRDYPVGPVAQKLHQAFVNKVLRG